MQKIYSTLISDIDFPSLINDCMLINQNVNDALFDAPQDYKIDHQTPFSTRVANFYNIFSHDSVEINSLLLKIKHHFYCLKPNPTKKYYIQGWVNLYKSGQNLGWHTHWGSDNSYHGFFCVTSNISYTEYKFHDGEHIKIDSTDGLLVITKSNDNQHRTSPCDNGDPRITIGFDIHAHDDVNKLINKWRGLNSSSQYFNIDKLINHWIPL